MKIRRYISKESLVKLALFLFMMGAASLFDVYHDDKSEFIVETESQNQSDQVVLYICNPSANLTLKAPGQRILLKNLPQAENARYIRQHHSLRTFHILKAEVFDFQDYPAVRNLIAFRNYHFTAPDDIPPAV